MKSADWSPSCAADKKKYKSNKTDWDTAIAVESDENLEYSNRRKSNILHIALSQKMGLTGTRSNAKNPWGLRGKHVNQNDPLDLKDTSIASRQSEKAAKCWNVSQAFEQTAA
jgi:hypothetical protein